VAPPLATTLEAPVLLCAPALEPRRATHRPGPKRSKLCERHTLPQPRAQEDWPDVVARPVPPVPDSVVPLDAPLGILGKAVFAAVLSLGRELGAPVPEIDPQQPISGAEAVEISHEILGDLFPGLR